MRNLKKLYKVNYQMVILFKNKAWRAFRIVFIVVYYFDFFNTGLQFPD